jgi:HEAT repeat protein
MKSKFIPWLFVALTFVLMALLVVRELWPEFLGAGPSLDDPDPAIRAAAIRALPLGCNNKALLDRLDDENANVRLLAAEKLGKDGYRRSKGSHGAERAGALIHMLDDESVAVRREAAWSLGSIGQDAAPALRSALTDDRSHGRSGAVLAIHFAYDWKDPDPWPSQKSEDVLRTIREMQNDSDPEVHRVVEEFLQFHDR